MSLLLVVGLLSSHVPKEASQVWLLDNIIGSGRPELKQPFGDAYS
jgi:hypothetical protein